MKWKCEYFFGADLRIEHGALEEKYSRKIAIGVFFFSMPIFIPHTRKKISHDDDDDARWPLKRIWRCLLTFTTQSSDPDAMTLSLCGHQAISRTGPLWPPTRAWSAGILPT